MLPMGAPFAIQPVAFHHEQLLMVKGNHKQRVVFILLEFVEGLFLFVDVCGVCGFNQFVQHRSR